MSNDGRATVHNPQYFNDASFVGYSTFGLIGNGDVFSAVQMNRGSRYGIAFSLFDEDLRWKSMRGYVGSDLSFTSAITSSNMGLPLGRRLVAIEMRTDIASKLNLMFVDDTNTVISSFYPSLRSGENWYLSSSSLSPDSTVALICGNISVCGSSDRRGFVLQYDTKTDKWLCYLGGERTSFFNIDWLNNREIVVSGANNIDGKFYPTAMILSSDWRSCEGTLLVPDLVDFPMVEVDVSMFSPSGSTFRLHNSPPVQQGYSPQVTVCTDIGLSEYVDDLSVEDKIGVVSSEASDTKLLLTLLMDDGVLNNERYSVEWRSSRGGVVVGTSISLLVDRDSSATYTAAITDRQTKCGLTVSFRVEGIGCEDLWDVGLAGGAQLRDSDSSRVYMLTDAEEFLSGGLWSSEKVSVDKSFSYSAMIRMSDGRDSAPDSLTSAGADGFAFVLQAGSASAVGASGDGIGYEGISRGIAIELDLYVNSSRRDPRGNHLAVFSAARGVLSSYHSQSTVRGLALDLPELRTDSTEYEFRIDYDAQRKLLGATISPRGEELMPQLVVPMDLSTEFSPSDRELWIGLTASTGMSVQRQEVLDFRRCGARRLSGVVSVEDERASGGVGDAGIYPHPVEDVVEFSVGGAAVEYEVYDIRGVSMGRVAVDSRIGDRVRLSLGFLPSGVYFLRAAGSVIGPVVKR